MIAVFIAANLLNRAADAVYEELGDGALRVAPGHSGVVLAGPHKPLDAGLYRIDVRARTTEQAATFYFDVSAETVLYGGREVSDSCSFLIHVYRTAEIDFRFWCRGEGLEVVGIGVTMLLADAADASAEEIGDLLREVRGQDAEVEVLTRLYDRLALAGKPHLASSLRNEAGESRPSGALAERFRRLHVMPAQINRKKLPAVDQIAVEKFLGERQYKMIDVLSTSREDRETLGVTYNLDSFQRSRLHREYDAPQPFWRNDLDPTLEASNFQSRPPLYERFNDFDRSHQWALAIGRGIAAYDPISGELLRSNHGILVPSFSNAYIFYRFEGVEIFYLITGMVSDTRIAVFIPKTGLVAMLSNHWLRNYPISDVIRSFERLTLTNGDHVLAYFTSPTRPAAVCGSDNLGHYFWTTMSGLDHATSSGSCEFIEEIVGVPKAFFDPREFFEELSNTPYHEFTTDHEAFAYCLRESLLPIHFTDAKISNRLAASVQRSASRRKIELPSNNPRPFLHMNLRAHTKVWEGAVEGNANILNALYERYGQLSVFVDGWIDCADQAAQIQALTNSEVIFYGGLGVPLMETLAWLNRIDAYICPIGSGLALSSWLLDKPGVTHAETAHMDQMNWWGMVRETPTMPLYPPVGEINDVGYGLYCNYEVDWRTMLEKLVSVLDAAGFRNNSNLPIEVI